MSNGDDEPSDVDDGDNTEAAVPTLSEDATEESLTEYLDAVAEQVETAETEADLDDAEALLGAGEETLGSADLPEPAEDSDDEDAENPRESLETRIETLEAEIDAKRGPYAEDVVSDIEAAIETIESTRWTETGKTEVTEAVTAFGDGVAGPIDIDVEPDAADTEDAVAALESIADAIENEGLDPDADAAEIATLVEAADALETGLDDAEEWDDLETNEQLLAQGFYDVLGHYKDFPVEWSALKAHEQEGNVDMILLALDSLQSEFMERHCLEALQSMGKRAATEDTIEQMLTRAGKRDRPAIRILGKMAAESATETLVEYVDEDSNPQLQKVTFKALGEIGAAEAVQPLADKLEMDNDNVRPLAARALGLIGDTRAVEPLAETLESDDSDDVRAAAAWALRQIGTETALEHAAKYTEERSYIVQTEAEKAASSLETVPPSA